MRRLAVILLPLLLGGCLRVEQELTIGSGNSGQYRLAARLPVAVYREFLEGATTGVAADYARFFDPEQGSRWFAEAEGVTVQRYRVYEQADMMHLRVEAEITDLEKALASGRLGRFHLGKRGAERTLWLDWPTDLSGGDAAARRALMAGVHLELRVCVPGPIVKSTTTTEDGRSATWVFTPDKQKDVFDAPPEVMVVFR